MSTRTQQRHAQAVVRLFAALLPAFLPACSSAPPAPLAGNHAAAAVSHPPAVASVAPALPPAGSGRGGYYMDDGPGDQTPEGLLATPDAEPRIEPYTTRGNRSYVVFGKRYTPFLDDRPFKQRGMGSWYGRKFHGQTTSSGEPYDMYKMTAAHPTMPLPSYARVTNVATGAQVIVRVNDRGPFHANRIIDLSYTAALKLGYLKKGSTELEVERLLPDEILRMAAARTAAPASQPQKAVMPVQASTNTQAAQPAVSVFAVPVAATATTAAPVMVEPAASGFYLQLGAFSQSGGAEAARSQLQQTWAGLLPPIELIAGDGLLRLFSGPFASRDEAQAVAQKIQAAGAARPMVVQR